MRLGYASRVARAFALATVVVCPTGLAEGQTRLLTGSVTDEAGEPVSGAVVTISCDGATRTTNTDRAGQFAVAVRSSSTRCDIITSRFGFHSSSARVEVGAFMRSPTIVLHRDEAMTTLAVGESGLGRVRASSDAIDLGRGWRVTNEWTSGRAADEVRSRTLQRVAGGARWQTEATAAYSTESGFRFESGVVVRKGYGAPLFMSRPFAGDNVLPELFPTPNPGSVRWDALFTLTTPDRPLHGIDLSGSFQAYLRLGKPQNASKPDRGLRASIHFKFK